MRTLTCYRCEQSIAIPADTIINDEGHGRFSVTIDGRYHSFSKKKICLAENTSDDIFDNTPVEIDEPEVEQPVALEDVSGIENIEGSDYGYQG